MKRNTLLILLIAAAVTVLATKQAALLNWLDQDFNLFKTIFDVSLATVMMAIPTYYLSKWRSGKGKAWALPYKYFGTILAFVIFVFYVLLFLMRLYMMADMYNSEPILLTLEYVCMGAIVFALAYPLVVKQENIHAE